MEARQDDGFLLALGVGRRVLTSARCRGRRPCALAAAGLGNDATFPSSGPVPVPLLRRENVRGTRMCAVDAEAVPTIVSTSQVGMMCPCGSVRKVARQKQWLCGASMRPWLKANHGLFLLSLTSALCKASAASLQHESAHLYSITQFLLFFIKIVCVVFLKYSLRPNRM